jgi:4-hydroxymandelate oxidase
MSRFSRRGALGSFGSLLAASPLLQGQELIGEPPGRITPRLELVNLFEVEAVAKRKLSSTAFSQISGSDRRAFDRITFRPRMLVDVRQMDLTTELLGERLFAPIIAGPMADQQQFHPDGELATARGASAAKTVMVVSSRSSQPLEKIAQASTSLWYQVYPETDLNAVRTRMHNAVQTGCKAVVLTVGTPYLPAGADGPPSVSRLKAMGNPGIDWNMIDRLRSGLAVPFLLKGIMSPEEAQAAVQKGVQGIVVSNHGATLSTGLAAPIDMLPGVADAVAGKVPILIDGSFRRGTDVLKALAFGARAVLVGRPILWGLSSYGAEGVQTVLGMLQNELARSMGLCGKANIKALDRTLLKVHLR